MNWPSLASDRDDSVDVTGLVAALHAAVATLPPAAVPALLAQLSALTMALSARLASRGGGDTANTECLSLAELAERLRLGQSTIRKMVEAGELQEGVHFRRVRRRLIFLWAAVEEYLRTRPTVANTQVAEAIPFVRRGRRRG